MKRGFTLVEMLVVISIIVLLAGLILPAVFRSKKKVKITKAKSLIDQLDAALQIYHDYEDNGDYPPTSLKDMGYSTNGINDGIESLIACLSSKESGQAYFEPPEDALQNKDRDRIPDSFKNDSAFDANDAFELVDPWGNPFVYVHWRDYDAAKTKSSKYKYRDKLGKNVIVKPGRSSVTKSFHNQMRYMIWSFGPDGKNDNGEGDDVCNWSKKKSKKKKK